MSFDVLTALEVYKVVSWVVTSVAQQMVAHAYYQASATLWELRSSGMLGYAYSAGRFRFRLRFRESAPVGAKNVLCLTVQVRIVVAGSGGSVQTVRVRRFTGMISSFLFRLSDSESETESACTIRVPLRNVDWYLPTFRGNLSMPSLRVKQSSWTVLWNVQSILHCKNAVHFVYLWLVSHPTVSVTHFRIHRMHVRRMSFLWDIVVFVVTQYVLGARW
jgi:hypothetical protein